MSEQNVPATGQIQIKVTDEILKGVYANMMQVAHTQEEFILDFMNTFPPSGIINSRVIVSPGHLKRIISALQENLKRYEDQFGGLKDGPVNPAPPLPPSTTGPGMGFDTNKAS